ncbi:MAG: hypothetical protein ACKOXI_00800 [Candidatus Planktophila sp.]
MKKLVAILVGVSVVVGASSSSAAIYSVGDPGRSWSQPNDAARGMHIQQFIDAVPNEIPSFLVLETNGYETKEDPTCTSIEDSKCIGKNLNFSAVLPRCVSDVDINCTVDVGIISSEGVKTSAVFGRYFPNHAQNEFTGNAARNLPSGVAGSIYSIPQALHDGGDKYYVSVVVKGGVSSSGQVTSNGIDVRITPVALEASGYFSASNEQRDAGWAQITDQNTGLVRWGQQGSGYSGNQYCVANSWKEKACAQKYAFPADIRYYVTTRLSTVPGGWMHGRVSSPDILISTYGAASTLEFRGNPIAVPTVYKMYLYPEMPDALKDQYDVIKGGYKRSPWCINSTGYCAGGRSGPSTDPLNRNVIISPDPWDPFGMEQLKLWLPYVNDKATALPSFWSVRTLSSNEMEGSSQCFKDTTKITGIVTTNSTQYSAGPPSFDKTEGTLGYQVASPHYGTTGDVFKGSYDLVMRSEVARCVYGFSKAPIQASLSITSADGSPQIATTLMGERNGWLYLSAKNFEFSAPIIKAKLTQEAPAPTPSPEVTTQVVTPKSSSILCIKGKSSKKVTAVNPKCPSGYKKSGK